MWKKTQKLLFYRLFVIRPQILIFLVFKIASPSPHWLQIKFSMSLFFYLLPAALRAAQACRYLIYTEADFEVFRPAGATRCDDGVKFGKEDGTQGPLLRAKFHPIGSTTRV